jgi:uncharacterized protein
LGNVVWKWPPHYLRWEVGDKKPPTLTMKAHLNSVIIALAIIVTAAIFANAFKNRNRSANTISVTGLGSKDFVSDLIEWNGEFERRNLVLKDAYAELDRDRETISKYLISKGMAANQIIFSAVNINKEFQEIEVGDGSRTRSVFSGYKLTQSVHLESTDVDRIEGISRQVSEIINSGIEFYSTAPQYYYTKLAELKVEMIATATKDANARAEKIAANAGAKVGALKTADMGVFQIVAQNSAEDYAWGGSFNTSSKRKTASITVKLAYETR